MIERAQLKEVALEVLAERDRAQAGKKIPEELNWRLIVQPYCETASRFMVYFYSVEPDIARLHLWNLKLNTWVTANFVETFDRTKIGHPLATPDLQRYL